MIDCDPTEGQNLLQRTVRDFAAAEIAPGVAARNEKGF